MPMSNAPIPSNPGLAGHSTANTAPPKRASADDVAGMRWWNALSDALRGFWMRQAGDTGRAVDAWRAYQRACATE